MENNHTLLDCEVQEGAELQMEINWGMQIVVKTWDNNNLNMDVLPIDRMVHIKAMLEHQTRVPSYQQRWIFSSKVMQDDFTLQDYNISNGETLLQRRKTGWLRSPGCQLIQCVWCGDFSVSSLIRGFPKKKKYALLSSARAQFEFIAGMRVLSGDKQLPAAIEAREPGRKLGFKA